MYYSQICSKPVFITLYERGCFPRLALLAQGGSVKPLIYFSYNTLLKPRSELITAREEVLLCQKPEKELQYGQYDFSFFRCCLSTLVPATYSDLPGLKMPRSWSSNRALRCVKPFS